MSEWYEELADEERYMQIDKPEYKPAILSRIIMVLLLIALMGLLIFLSYQV